LTSKLLVGLGNPGQSYEKTRHNAGFMVIAELLFRYPKVAVEVNSHVFLWEIDLSSQCRVLVAAPQNFMNRSGVVVSYLIEKYGVNLSNLLIIYDDFHLPLGQIRFRREGSSGGHNGIKSVIESLDANQIPRLKVGIGNGHSVTAVDFVLGEFEESESDVLAKAIKISADACAFFVSNNILRAMDTFN